MVEFKQLQDQRANLRKDWTLSVFPCARLRPTFWAAIVENRKKKKQAQRQEDIAEDWSRAEMTA